MDQTVAALCSLPDSHLFIFSDIVPKIVYYSHLPILAACLILGLFVFFHGRKYLANRALFAMLMSFVGWLVLDAVTWASNDPSIIMFVWSALLFFEVAIYASALYLTQVLIGKRDFSKFEKWLIVLLFIPIAVFLPTQFNLSGFDLASCLAIEGPMPLYYAYSLEILFSLWIIALGIKNYFKTLEYKEKVFIKWFSLAMCLFLFLFASGNIVGSVTTNWKIAQFGLFGMPILAAYILYLIIKQQFFNIKLAISEILVFAIIILSGAQFFLIESSRVFNVISFIVIVFFGIFLLRGMKREGKKEVLENLTQEIYKKNVEMAIKNKTLSLLRTLYQISILSLDPSALSEKLTQAIRQDLNLEMTGIFSFDKEKDTLIPYHFAKSDRLIESLDTLGFHFKDIHITDVSKKEFFSDSVYKGIASISNNIEKVWSGLVSKEALQKIDSEAHIKTIVLFPLIIEGKTVGVLLLGFNRDYDTLNAFEKESIKSLIDVVAVAIDRANLYKEVNMANEKLKSLDALKTEFLSLASHQLRSPLTAIKGYTSMLLEGDFGTVNDKQKEAINRVFESSKHLATVVEDLLNVSKIEQGGMQYTMEPFDFEKAVHDLATDLSVTAEKKGLKLSFETDNKAPYTVNGDTEKLRQVILNLIDNSVKYTATGWIKVSVTKDEATKKIKFAVSDSGMGISPATINDLFQKFSRGAGGKVNTGGSGLGLYLGKEIIAAHKGHIWAESPGEGKGSTFAVELDMG